VIASAQDASNTTNTTPETPYPFFQPSYNMNGGDVNGVLAGIAIQMQYSQMYGKFILDFQSAQGWLQVAQGWVAMTAIENKGAPGAVGFFEEEKDLEEDDEEEHPDYDAIERQSETTLLHVLKIMYLQAAQKLQDAKTSNYQHKAQLSLLVQAGVGQVFPQIIYLSYYLESIRLMSSMITIQRQDAWTTWLLHEIMETDEFDNSKGFVPPTFVKTLAKSREVAMQLYHTEASLDLQIYMMDYYMQFSLMQMLQQQPTNAAGATSFVEEGVSETAEPSKPFFSPFMMMGGMMGGMGGPQYLTYMATYMKYFAIIMNVQAAQGLYTHAHLEAENDSNGMQYSGTIKMSSCSALQQWAYLKYQLAMLEMWGLFMGQSIPTANNNAAATNAFVQTDAAASQ